MATKSYESDDPRYPNNVPPSTINQDLANERANTPFNPTLITNFIDGNVDITNKRRQLESWIIRDPTGVSLYVLNDVMYIRYCVHVEFCVMLFSFYIIGTLMLMYCLMSISQLSHTRYSTTKITTIYTVPIVISDP